jgi:hypothetical protein
VPDDHRRYFLTTHPWKEWYWISAQAPLVERRVTIWFGLRVVTLLEGTDGETCRAREVPTMRV